jgi:hypothetical protein
MSEFNALGFKKETQSMYELDMLVDFMIENNVLVFCEIGSYAGTTLQYVHKFLREAFGPEAPLVFVSVELPVNMSAFNNLNSLVIPEIRTDSNTEFHLFVGNSTAPDIVESVHTVMDDWWNTPFRAEMGKSLVFIDGEHSYRQSRDDYRAYKDFFDFVAFNDVSPRTSQKQIAKHNHDVATVYHLFDAITLDMPLDSYTMWDDLQATNPRGIGVLL